MRAAVGGGKVYERPLLKVSRELRILHSWGVNPLADRGVLTLARHGQLYFGDSSISRPRIVACDDETSSGGAERTGGGTHSISQGR